MTSEAVSRKDGAFVSPFWDFIFVGGLTFLFLPVFVFFDVSPFALGVMAITAYILSPVNDNPHFMHSYQVMYEGFSRKIGKGNNSASRVRYFFFRCGGSCFVVGWLCLRLFARP